MTKDLLWAMRWLARNPLFAAGVIGILALGIGASTAVFSVVDAVLWRPIPYESSGRLVKIDETATKRMLNGVPAQDYLRWRDRNDVIEKSVPFLKDTVTVTGGGDPDQVIAVRTAGALFPLLGVRARLGRTLAESDDTNLAVISDRLWQRRFHSDPGVIGRPITISDELFTIAGVMPREFEFPSSEVEVWTPLRLTPASTIWVQVIARLKRDVGVAQARSAFKIVERQMEQEDPAQRAGLRIDITPWNQSADRKYELTLLFVLAAVGLVLLIACADAGSLLLSRAVHRQREIAIRASLGAGFWRVLRQLLAESFVMAALGSAAGIVAARYLVRFLSNQLAALPVVLPRLQRVEVNGRVLVFNIVLCVVLAILCSAAPALLASRTDVQGVLRGGRGSGRRESNRLFSILIASEAAFAFLLLVGSGLMIRSLVRLQSEDHGFRPDHVLTMRIPAGVRAQVGPPGKYNTRAAQMAYYREIVERVERIPGIRDVAVVNNLPLSGVNATVPVLGTDGKPMLVSTRTISPRYFAAMGIPLLAGRVFEDRDQAGSPGVAIINEYLARELFKDRPPVGQVLPSESANSGPPVTVVGVVKDTSQMSYEQPAKGEIYRPLRQFIFAAFMSTIVVRTPGDPLVAADALKKAVWSVDPNQPVVKIATMRDIVNDSIWRPRFSAWIFSVLGGLALLLTAAGVYGVIAYTTSLRAHEVGIRVALGATPRIVVGVIVRDALIPLVAGLVVSIVAALALSRLLSTLLYEVATTDPVTYLIAAVVILGIGVAASLSPAWKAAAADPMKALRE